MTTREHLIDVLLAEINTVRVSYEEEDIPLYDLQNDIEDIFELAKIIVYGADSGN